MTYPKDNRIVNFNEIIYDIIFNKVFFCFLCCPLKHTLLPCPITESGLSLEMQNSVSVNEGDRLKLTCKVHGVTWGHQLSVSWQHKATSTLTATFTNVIGLNQEGVVEKAAEFMSRKVKATRPATDAFTLELDDVTPPDSGVYQCVVSEWKINSKIISQSQTAAVTVAPTGKLCLHLCGTMIQDKLMMNPPFCMCIRSVCTFVWISSQQAA